MKFMEKAKRFFTLNAAKHEGFTLVELIVVIAILAILAGVAVPAYSGYIKKAEKAGDMQLLGAVNEAFAAACMSEGTQAILVNSATLTWENDCIKGIATVNGAYDEGIDAAFKMFYAGNENSAFKALAEKLVFANGVFAEDGTVTVTGNYKGQSYQFNQSSVQNFWNSVFAENVAGLQQDMQNLTNSFGDVAGSVTNEELATIFGDDYAKYLTDKGANDANSIGNATVLYIADKTAGMTAQSAGEALLAAQDVLNKGGGIQDLEDPLTTTAMMYGAVTAYANGAGKDTALAEQLAKGVTSQSDLVKLFDAASKDSSFLKYVGSTDGEGKLTVGEDFTKDMNGYFGALDAMDTVSGDIDVTGSNLWNSDDIKDLLESLK